MSNIQQGPGWWQASDGKWYPPESHPGPATQQMPAFAPAPPGLPLWKRRPLIIAAALIVVLLIVAGIAGGTKKKTSTIAVPKPTTAVPAAAPTTARPPSTTTTAVPGLTADQKRTVRVALTRAVDHAAAVFAAGKTALGFERYPNAEVGLAAFNDPHSGASRFSNFRSSTPKPEFDPSYILSGFAAGDAPYTAANEPQAISTWRDDMFTEQTALRDWVQVAVSWQISSATDQDLAAAANKVDAALATTRADIEAVLAAS